MANYSTIKVDEETYSKLLKLQLKVQSRLGRDLSLTETIRLLTELAEKPSTARVSQEEFEKSLEKFCPEMEGIETKEVRELQKALGVTDAKS